MTADPIVLYVLLSRRDAATQADFCRYWQDVHGPIAARLPGLGFYRQLHLDDGRGYWPALAGVGASCGEADRIEGIAEMHFASAEELAAYGREAHHVRADERNVFRRSVRYLGDSPGLAAFVASRDATGGFTLLALIRRKPQVAPERFSEFLHGDLAQRFGEAGAAQVRVLSLKERDNSQNHLLSPGVDHDTPLDRQYQAAIELAFPDPIAARNVFDSDSFADTLGPQGDYFRDLHVYRVRSTPVMVREGRMTLSGLRGHSTAELIVESGAVNQTGAEVCAMFCDPSNGRAPATPAC